MKDVMALEEGLLQTLKSLSEDNPEALARILARRPLEKRLAGLSLEDRLSGLSRREIEAHQAAVKRSRERGRRVFKDYDLWQESMSRLFEAICEDNPEAVDRALPSLAPEDRLRGLTPEDRLRGLPPEELERLKQLLH